MPSWQMPNVPVPEPPPPQFSSWANYLLCTSPSQRMVRCYAAAKKANRKRLLSETPDFRLSGRDVWALIEAACGRCAYCNSLAVESRPSNSRGAPIAWAQVGRRIGCLEHKRMRFGGGDNNLSNLSWACLWCNTWPSERKHRASDHGGFYPAEDSADQVTIKMILENRRSRAKPTDDGADNDFEMYPDHECPWDVGHAD
jgi:hypothetical protein